MQNDIKVDIQGEPGANIQFGRDSSYRAPATVNKTYLKFACGIFLVISVTALLFGPPDEPVSMNRSSRVDALSEQNMMKNRNNGLENFEETYKNSEVAPNRSRKINALAGPESLEKNEKVFFEPGTTIEAQIVTGGSMGFVKAKLKRDLANTPLRAGSILIGKATYTNDRIQIGFSKAVVGNKTAFTISAYAASAEDKESGIEISLWDQYGRQFGVSAGLYMVSGVAQGLQSKQEVGSQLIARPTLENAALEGVKTATMETANQIITDQKSKDYKPDLKTELLILVVFDGEIAPSK